MKKLTIFTPVYNRAEKLKMTYDSLVRQSNKNFIWLIIDDGSTDEVYKSVDEWKKEGKIDIQFYRKENGGKHTAFNYALEVIKTELVFISLDSDDYLEPDAVEFILNTYNDEYKIMATLWNDSKNANVKKFDVKKVKELTLAEAYSRNLVNAELNYIFRTDYLAQYSYPVFKNENFFTEAYIFYQMDEKVLWTDKVVRRGEYLSDGLTSNVISLFYNNPNSWYLYNKIRTKKTRKIMLKIKYTMYEVAFGILSNKKKIIKNSCNKLLTVLVYPMGVLGSLYIKKKGKNK